MYASMHERLRAIAKADSDREEEIGARRPIRLDLWLTGGHEILNVELVDGENSLDDRSIDVKRRYETTEDQLTIAIEHIAMIAETWPKDADVPA